MGGCQSTPESNNNKRDEKKRLDIEVLYCGGNTVKPYFDELCEYLMAQPSFQDKISIRGRQDLMFTGRFEIFLLPMGGGGGGGGKKELIHSKKHNEGQGWARKPEEREAICERIQEELNKRGGEAS